MVKSSGVPFSRLRPGSRVGPTREFAVSFLSLASCDSIITFPKIPLATPLWKRKQHQQTCPKTSCISTWWVEIHDSTQTPSYLHPRFSGVDTFQWFPLSEIYDDKDQKHQMRTSALQISGLVHFMISYHHLSNLNTTPSAFNANLNVSNTNPRDMSEYLIPKSPDWSKELPSAPRCIAPTLQHHQWRLRSRRSKIMVNLRRIEFQ